MAKLNLNKFSANLYKQLSHGKDGNLFISPFSIASALAMCYVGAKDNTAAQLRQVLGFENLDNDRILKLTSELMSSLNSVNSVELCVANKIYPMEGFEVKKDFADALVKSFMTEVQSLDFARNTESAKAINDWVEQKTKNKITDLIPADALNEMTRLVVVNAIYFKGSWNKKFDKSRTRQEDFHLQDGSTTKVDMMRLSEKRLRYAAGPAGLPVLTCELPYAGYQVSMTIILPNKGVDLTSVESSLDDAKLRSVVFDKSSREVNVYLPKFKLEHSEELSDPIIALGAPEAFDPNKANFKGISDSSTGLSISKVVHKAFVDVNEEGTEAAAATGIVASLTSIRQVEPPVEFKCDRPFLFAIHHNDSGNLLFLGKYAKP